MTAATSNTCAVCGSQQQILTQEDDRNGEPRFVCPDVMACLERRMSIGRPTLARTSLARGTASEGCAEGSERPTVPPLSASPS